MSHHLSDPGCCSLLPEMGQPTQGLWKTSSWTGRHPLKIGSNDFEGGKYANLIRDPMRDTLMFLEQALRIGWRISHIRCATWYASPAVFLSTTV